MLCQIMHARLGPSFAWFVFGSLSQYKQTNKKQESLLLKTTVDVCSSC